MGTVLTRTGCRRLTLGTLISLGWLLASGPATTQQKAPQPPKLLKPAKPVFLTVRQKQLYLGEIPYRNIGVNIPDLFERFLHGDDASAVKALADAKAAGVHFVRCWGTTWSADGFGTFEQDPTRWMDAFDRMLAAANRDNIAVVPSLLFNPNMLPEYVRRTAGKDEQIVNYLTPGSASNNLAVAYVTAIVSRFANDPRVLFWEIGNEYNLEADLSAQWKSRPTNQIPTSDQICAFLIQIATLIHHLDKRHLVTSGNADMRPAAWHMRQAMLAHRGNPRPLDYPMDWTPDTFPEYREMLDFFNPPPLDILSVHAYPPEANDTPFWITEDGKHAFRLPWISYAAYALGKPLLVGEVGQKVFVSGKEQDTPWLLDALQRVEAGIVPIAAVWSWEFGQGNSDQTVYSLSPQNTPQLVKALTAANSAILSSIARTAVH